MSELEKDITDAIASFGMKPPIQGCNNSPEKNRDELWNIIQEARILREKRFNEGENITFVNKTNTCGNPDCGFCFPE